MKFLIGIVLAMCGSAALAVYVTPLLPKNLQWIMFIAYFGVGWYAVDVIKWWQRDKKD